MKFSKKLIALRHAKGLSQQQLGDALKLAPEIINSWEIGLSTPDLEQLNKLSHFFGLPVETLMKGIDNHDPQVLRMTDVAHATPADTGRQRVITQLEILSGALAAVTLLGTLVYLCAPMF